MARPTRAQIRQEVRDEEYKRLKNKATTGRELLYAALDFLLAELTDLAKLQSAREDKVCRELVEDIEKVAYDTRKEADDERKNQITIRQRAHLRRR
ncbi:hypothetical protein FXF51_02295 [Nonomuraea sp. PA05]|uniref:hypothetical protein n=1 Tax=Nonomuraea sp. PA05 TaxID=2604466 RepID=UPI0011DA6ABA|nr:hypothetical protein [Nonomuraea sp. PA05]TYB71284.1 hypothetical protein FXF51_02295 [Nonomuraea sp. PA05]